MCINNVHDDITITEEESTWIGNIIILDMLIINIIVIYIMYMSQPIRLFKCWVISSLAPPVLLWVRPMVSTRSNLINAIDIDL